LNQFFKTVPLSGIELLYIAGVAVALLAVSRFVKLFINKLTREAE